MATPANICVSNFIRNFLARDSEPLLGFLTIWRRVHLLFTDSLETHRIADSCNSNARTSIQNCIADRILVAGSVMLTARSRYFRERVSKFRTHRKFTAESLMSLALMSFSL